ncbi:MAG TPA: LLM class flavin-dependent oxidoreductase [Trebonia sp.]|jgi:alkanesulfonate monooxygenase SsuD/methylene tetrahydromethanopterin reductase-like flavin-dependent oxidoreductase (luciferase family)
MKVAIGLPTAIAGTSAACLLDWAQRAEEAGFSSLAVLDRIAYRNHDPVPVLAAAAAVTRGIGLLSAVLLGPVRGNGAILAKQLADIDDLSGGRLTIGIAAGARADDFALTGTDFEKRGRQHDLLLDQLAWRAAVADRRKRPGQHPQGNQVRGRLDLRQRWTGQFAAGAAQVRAAWSAGGRAGRPRLAAVSYFALGPDAAGLARDFLGDYYGFRGDADESVIAATPTGPAEMAELAATMAALGCDELVLYPCSNDTTQMNLLAEVISGPGRRLPAPGN